MPEDCGEFCQQYEAEFKPRWNKVRLSVMVLGPNTEKHTLGASIRKLIIERCRTYGFPIIGEHKDLIEIHRRITGTSHNLCSMERDLAFEVDAIIIIPDSAGSFVELGMFVFHKKLCGKSLILFSNKYPEEHPPTFISLGPKLAYGKKGAQIEYVDYRQKNKTWQKVDDFLTECRGIKYDETPR